MGATDRDDGNGNGNGNVPDAPAHSRATSVDTVSRSNSMCVFDSFGDGELEHERVHRVTPGTLVGVSVETGVERRRGDVPGRTRRASTFARLFGHPARRVRGHGGR